MDDTIYLDQNILGYLKDEIISLEKGSFEYIFSDAHFREIPPENPEPFINVLNDYKARLIKLDPNDKLENTANIYEYSPVEVLYKNFLSNDHGDLYTIFNPLLARLSGAKNYPEVINLPEKFNKAIDNLLKDAPLKEAIKVPITSIIQNLKYSFENLLTDIKPIEDQRKQFGTNKGKLSTLGNENTIIKMNEEIKHKSGYDFLSIIDDKYKDKSNFQKVIILNALLNHLGYNADTNLSSEGKITNILNDSIHIAYAMFCNYFLSEDRRLVNKASAIYQYLNLSTVVVKLELK